MDASTTTGSKPGWAPVAAAIAWGALAWFVGAWVTGRREPWDSDAYWFVVYPALLLGGLALAWRYPARAWRWPLLVFFGQFVGATLRAGEVSNLWPLALAWFAVLALPGVALAKWVAGRRMSSG